MPLKEGFKKMNLNVEAGLHNQFKAAVSMQNKNMTDVLLDFIRAYVKKHLPGASGKRKQNRG
jgi:hypothetical protein